jgi:hypothetical protein
MPNENETPEREVSSPRKRSQGAFKLQLGPRKKPYVCLLITSDDRIYSTKAIQILKPIQVQVFYLDLGAPPILRCTTDVILGGL